MDALDRLAPYWWHLLVGAHTASFLLGLGLWFTGTKPLAVFFILFALLLPFSIVAVLLDGQ